MTTAVMRAGIRISQAPGAPADLIAAMRFATAEQLEEAATLIEEAPPSNPAEKARLIRELIARLRAGRGHATDRQAPPPAITVHPARPAPPAATRCTAATCKPKKETTTVPKKTTDDLDDYAPPDTYGLVAAAKANPARRRTELLGLRTVAAFTAVAANRAAEMEAFGDLDDYEPPDSWGLVAAAKAKKSAA